MSRKKSVKKKQVSSSYDSPESLPFTFDRDLIEAEEFMKSRIETAPRIIRKGMPRDEFEESKKPTELKMIPLENYKRLNKTEEEMRVMDQKFNILSLFIRHSLTNSIRNGSGITLECFLSDLKITLENDHENLRQVLYGNSDPNIKLSKRVRECKTCKTHFPVAIQDITKQLKLQCAGATWCNIEVLMVEKNKNLIVCIKCEDTDICLPCSQPKYKDNEYIGRLIFPVQPSGKNTNTKDEVIPNNQNNEPLEAQPTVVNTLPTNASPVIINPISNVANMALSVEEPKKMILPSSKIFLLNIVPMAESAFDPTAGITVGKPIFKPIANVSSSNTTNNITVFPTVNPTLGHREIKRLQTAQTSSQTKVSFSRDGIFKVPEVPKARVYRKIPVNTELQKYLRNKSKVNKESQNVQKQLGTKTPSKIQDNKYIPKCSPSSTVTVSSTLEHQNEQTQFEMPISGAKIPDKQYIHKYNPSSTITISSTLPQNVQKQPETQISVDEILGNQYIHKYPSSTIAISPNLSQNAQKQPETQILGTNIPHKQYLHKYNPRSTITISPTLSQNLQKQSETLISVDKILDDQYIHKCNPSSTITSSPTLTQNVQNQPEMQISVANISDNQYIPKYNTSRTVTISPTLEHQSMQKQFEKPISAAKIPDNQYMSKYNPSCTIRTSPTVIYDAVIDHDYIPIQNSLQLQVQTGNALTENTGDKLPSEEHCMVNAVMERSTVIKGKSPVGVARRKQVPRKISIREFHDITDEDEITKTNSMDKMIIMKGTPWEVFVAENARQKKEQNAQKIQAILEDQQISHTAAHGKIGKPRLASVIQQINAKINLELQNELGEQRSDQGKVKIGHEYCNSMERVQDDVNNQLSTVPNIGNENEITVSEEVLMQERIQENHSKNVCLLENSIELGLQEPNHGFQASVLSCNPGVASSEDRNTENNTSIWKDNRLSITKVAHNLTEVNPNAQSQSDSSLYSRFQNVEVMKKNHGVPCLDKSNNSTGNGNTLHQEKEITSSNASLPEETQSVYGNAQPQSKLTNGVENGGTVNEMSHDHHEEVSEIPTALTNLEMLKEFALGCSIIEIALIKRTVEREMKSIIDDQFQKTCKYLFGDHKDYDLDEIARNGDPDNLNTSNNLHQNQNQPKPDENLAPKERMEDHDDRSNSYRLLTPAQQVFGKQSNASEILDLTQNRFRNGTHQVFETQRANSAEDVYTNNRGSEENRCGFRQYIRNIPNEAVGNPNQLRSQVNHQLEGRNISIQQPEHQQRLSSCNYYANANAERQETKRIPGLTPMSNYPVETNSSFQNPREVPRVTPEMQTNRNSFIMPTANGHSNSAHPYECHKPSEMNRGQSLQAGFTSPPVSGRDQHNYYYRRISPENQIQSQPGKSGDKRASKRTSTNSTNSSESRNQPNAKKKHVYETVPPPQLLHNVHNPWNQTHTPFQGNQFEEQGPPYNTQPNSMFYLQPSVGNIHPGQNTQRNFSEMAPGSGLSQQQTNSLPTFGNQHCQNSHDGSKAEGMLPLSTERTERRYVPLLVPVPVDQLQRYILRPHVYPIVPPGRLTQPPGSGNDFVPHKG